MDKKEKEKLSLLDKWEKPVDALTMLILVALAFYFAWNNQINWLIFCCTGWITGSIGRLKDVLKSKS